MEINTIVSILIGVIIGGVLTYVAINYNGGSNVDLSKNLITNQKAIQMIDEQQERDTSSFSGHLELGTLMSYVAYVDDLCKAGNNRLSGLELYFGRENDKITFLLYPTTYSDQFDDHIPFDPLASNDTIVELKSIKLSGQFLQNEVALNRSGMSPPRRPTY